LIRCNNFAIAAIAVCGVRETYATTISMQRDKHLGSLVNVHLPKSQQRREI